MKLSVISIGYRYSYCYYCSLSIFIIEGNAKFQLEMSENLVRFIDYWNFLSSTDTFPVYGLQALQSSFHRNVWSLYLFLLVHL